MLGKRPRQYRQDIVAPGDWHIGFRPATGHAGDAGHDLDRMIAFEAPPHVHERAIEERIALGEQPDRAAIAQVRRDAVGRATIEIRDLRPIGDVRHRHFLGDGIFQPQLVPPDFDQWRHDAARVTLEPTLGEIGDDVGRAHQARCAQGQIAHIARPDADAIQGTGTRRARDIVERIHSASLAIALTAATAMALPPLRPFTIRYGTRPSVASASFDSAAPTKPTAVPMTAAGRGAPASSMSSRWNSEVGALPIAT